VVLLAGIHAALQPLERPAERSSTRAARRAPSVTYGSRPWLNRPTSCSQQAHKQQLAIDRPVASEPLGDRELAQAVALQRSVRSAAARSVSSAARAAGASRPPGTLGLADAHKDVAHAVLLLVVVMQATIQHQRAG